MKTSHKSDELKNKKKGGKMFSPDKEVYIMSHFNKLLQLEFILVHFLQIYNLPKSKKHEMIICIRKPDLC
jgi:hypothetical protein